MAKYHISLKIQGALRLSDLRVNKHTESEDLITVTNCISIPVDHFQLQLRMFVPGHYLSSGCKEVKLTRRPFLILITEKYRGSTHLSHVICVLAVISTYLGAVLNAKYLIRFIRSSQTTSYVYISCTSGLNAMGENLL